MKTYLKHKYGYLNVDDNFIYLTKSGNWSETKNLKEKNSDGFKTMDRFSKIKIIGYLVFVAGLFLFGILNNIVKGDFSYLLVFGLPVLFYATYNYLIPEIGASFLIPFSKVKTIEIIENNAIIHFIDFNEKYAQFNLTGLNEKGIEIVHEIISKRKF